ncbi:hypothetical protein SEA_TENNO_66 [Arthrobacter phage Tenno]|uniref:Uncharacterized protein n=1 Tax=Arthrobacter phage Tenno TaxID=2315702 RepID=A0A386KNU5_9CAUD|nr:hypothetical protein SEA_TENNO_66 [Arthrobacter phage Tenno]
MPTFQRTETVDARQFTGEGQNGSDLVFWVLSNNGRASHQPTVKVGKRFLPERIRLDICHDNYAIVRLGDWIVRHQDGTWEAMRPEHLQEEYDEV